MKAMKRLLEQNTASGQRRVPQVFRDFCELKALGIRNIVDPQGRDIRDVRLGELASSYTPAEHDRFEQLFKALVDELERGLSDVLGELYMSLDLGNERLGQFFTPYSVSRLMAQLSVSSATAKLKTQPFITVAEPASGSGGMVIAFADALRRQGANYQRTMHVTAQDLDITAVHMTYIQLSLLFVPAVVHHGNTLTAEIYDTWPTPAHVLGRWDHRLSNATSLIPTT